MQIDAVCAILAFILAAFILGALCAHLAASSGYDCDECKNYLCDGKRCAKERRKVKVK